MLKEITFIEYLRGVNLVKRYLFASFFTGLVSTFGGYLPVNLFGVWATNWMHWKTNLVLIAMWSGIAYVSMRFKSGVFLSAVPILASIIAFVPMGLSSRYGFLAETWMVWLYVFTSVAINVTCSIFFRKQVVKE